jgi:hypothetical protein
MIHEIYQQAIIAVGSKQISTDRSIVLSGQRNISRFVDEAIHPMDKIAIVGHK